MTVPDTTPGTISRVRNSKATIVRRLAAASALALAVCGLSAALASAGSNERIDVKYGYATFDSEGERLAAGDIWPDHRGVRAKLTWFEDGVKHFEAVTDGSEGLESSRNLSIPDRTTVFLQLCYTRDGVDDNCTESRRGEA
jgi:hypothetical protein